MSRQQWVLAAGIVACLGAAFDARAQGYGGPSVLSRGGNQPGIRGRAPINFNMYASARGLYETGLIAPELNESGELESRDAYGVQAEVGLYGGKDWQRHSLGVDFRADYRQQTSLGRFNGTNQALALSTQHRLSRRLFLLLQQTGGISNRAFGAYAAPTFGGLDRLGVPFDELFDTRVYYAQSSARLSYQASARTSYAVGVDGFFTKRRALALVNGQGFRAQGSWGHRISRRTTVVANLQYLRFEFPRVFSISDIYALSIGVQRVFTRNWQLDVTGGWYNITSSGVQQVPLSPEVAAILGRPTGFAAFVRTERPPLVEGTLSYLQERGRAYVSVLSGVNAGNGVFLTTNRTSVNSGYSYTGLRRLSLGVSAGWTRVGSVVLDLDSFNMWRAGGGLSYRIAEHLSIMGQSDWRRFNGGQAVQGRSGTSTVIGLAYTPSRFPISIW
jgi:hypothetical protein